VWIPASIGILATSVTHEFLTFDPDVMSAATNPGLSEAQHFIVQRVADLLAHADRSVNRRVPSWTR